MIKYFSAFAGIGGFDLGIARTIPDAECIGISEVDKHAIKIYDKHFPDRTNFGDIKKIKTKDLPDFDLFCGGFPCFIKGTLVLTRSGFHPIENIKEDMLVLTHKNRFRRVTSVMNRDYQGDLVRLQFRYGLNDITCTKDHPFYVRKRTQYWNNSIRTYDVSLSEPQWLKATDLTTEHYVGFPVPEINIIPEFNYQHGINQYVSVTKKLSMDSEDFWWCVGYWLAEGWYEKRRRRTNDWEKSSRVVVCVCKGQLNIVLPRFQSVFKKIHIVEERTVFKLHILEKGFYSFVSTLGEGSHSKHFPEDFMYYPNNILKALLDGYVYGDGCHIRTTVAITTVSKQLANDARLALSILYKHTASVYGAEPQKSRVIEGRAVQETKTYIARLHQRNIHRKTDYFIDNVLWVKVNQIEKYRTNYIKVYNLEVAEDESYTANGAIVHNCQDVSIAGKRAGLCGARSGLFFEIVRIVRKKQPRIVFLENVKGILSSNKGWDFAKILVELDGAGYSVEWAIYNSKDFGVPQNRERVFIIGHLGRETGTKIFPLREDGQIHSQTGENQEKIHEISTCLTSGGNDKWNGTYIAHSLTAGGHSGGLHSQMDIIAKGTVYRRFTPVECERLMGFPDMWTSMDKDGKKIADTQRYKTLGNAVVVPVVEAIMATIREKWGLK